MKLSKRLYAHNARHQIIAVIPLPNGVVYLHSKDMITSNEKISLFLKICAYVVGIAAMILFLRSDFATGILAWATNIPIIAEFVAGMMYTSFFTIPLSGALFATLAGTTSLYTIALVGGLGAALADYAMLTFFRKVGKRKSKKDRFLSRMVKKIPKPVAIVIGLVCLMLPVPDEIAMVFLGIGKARPWLFVLVVYPAKAVAIGLIVLSLQAI